jgi:hypothetical protein
VCFPFPPVIAKHGASAGRQDPREPKRLYAAVNSAWFGPHIHASTNGGKTWKLSEKGLELKCVPDQSIKRIWHICPGHAD